LYGKDILDDFQKEGETYESMVERLTANAAEAVNIRETQEQLALYES
jgi:hypothetical protein